MSEGVNDVRREIEDECVALAKRAAENGDPALETALLVACTLSSFPDDKKRRDRTLALWAITGGELVNRLGNVE